MFPYTQNVGSLISVIKAIGNHGVPDKFSSKELPVWGFKSSNDRSVVGVLRHIGFIDKSGSPQQLWKDARTTPEVATAVGTRLGYVDLFKTFPDAHRKDAEALTNFFKAKTTVGDAVVKQMVSTFRALAQFGDFDSEGVINTESSADKAEPGSTDTRVIHKVAGSPGVTINLNVALTVPTDATGEVYDKFFAAMKKHLLDAAK